MKKHPTERLSFWLLLALLMVFRSYRANAQWWGNGSHSSNSVVKLVFSGSTAEIYSTSGSITGNGTGQGTYRGIGTYTWHSGSNRYVGTTEWGAAAITISSGTMAVSHHANGSSNYIGSWSQTEPEPTPTPTPSPTPDHTGTVEITGAESGIAEMMVDVDGDGVYETSLGLQNFSELNSPTWENNGEYDGKNFRVILRAIYADGVKIGQNRVLASGTFGEATPDPIFSGTVALNEVEATSGMITIGPDGEVSSQPVYYSNSTVGGNTSNSYTYQNSSGQYTTLTYNSAGTSEVVAADVRQQTAMNSAENERIIAQLKGINEKLEAAASPTPTVTPHPVPDTPGFSVDPFEAAETVKSGIAALAPVEELEPLSTSMPEVTASIPSGNPNFWKFDVVLLGQTYTFDFYPLNNPYVATLATWIRLLLVLIVSAIALWHIYDVVSDFQRAWAMVPASDRLGMMMDIREAVKAMVAGFATFIASVKGAVAAIPTGGLSAVIAFLIACWSLIKAWAPIVGIIVLWALPALILNTLVWWVLPALPTYISTYVNLQDGFGSANSTNPLGGQGMFQAIAAHLQSATGAIAEGVALLDKFVPIIHIIVSFGNVFGIKRLANFWWGLFVRYRLPGLS